MAKGKKQKAAIASKTPASEVQSAKPTTRKLAKRKLQAGISGNSRKKQPKSNPKKRKKKQSADVKPADDDTSELKEPLAVQQPKLNQLSADNSESDQSSSPVEVIDLSSDTSEEDQSEGTRSDVDDNFDPYGSDKRNRLVGSAVNNDGKGCKVQIVTAFNGNLTSTGKDQLIVLAKKQDGTNVAAIVSGNNSQMLSPAFEKCSKTGKMKPKEGKLVSIEWAEHINARPVGNCQTGYIRAANCVSASNTPEVKRLLKLSKTEQLEHFFNDSTGELLLDSSAPSTGMSAIGWVVGRREIPGQRYALIDVLVPTSNLEASDPNKANAVLVTFFEFDNFKVQCQPGDMKRFVLSPNQGAMNKLKYNLDSKVPAQSVDGKALVRLKQVKALSSRQAFRFTQLGGLTSVHDAVVRGSAFACLRVTFENAGQLFDTKCVQCASALMFQKQGVKNGKPLKCDECETSNNFDSCVKVLQDISIKPDIGSLFNQPIKAKADVRTTDNNWLAKAFMPDWKSVDFFRKKRVKELKSLMTKDSNLFMLKVNGNDVKILHKCIFKGTPVNSSSSGFSRMSPSKSWQKASPQKEWMNAFD
jgi:hypothetical protein